jgi:acetyl-CoA C-acetyltransferase
MSRSPSRIPVIIGLGELTDRPARPDDGLEPLAILERCIAAADEEAGGGWLSRIDVLRVVNQVSWPYRDLAGLLGRRLRMRGAETIYGPVGGETPVRMLVDAAVDIASGLAEVAVVCGAEALKTRTQLAREGRAPAWSDPEPDARAPRGEDFASPLAVRYGLIDPIAVYPLYENAMRAAAGRTLAEDQAESGAIWSAMSQVAARNPYAWSGRPMAAEAIVQRSEQNRPIAFPYQKFMVAQLAVNQGAAVLLTHLEAARAAGIPDEQLVYVWSGAGASEPKDVLARPNFETAPALARVLRRTLEINGVETADIDLWELYSCFPCVPKLARAELGLAADTPLTVAGGLTFFGGPGNDYMTHAITAMCRALRGGEGRAGMLYGNGEYVTKHHAAVLSTTPPAGPVRNLELQAEVEAAQEPLVATVDDYEGPCTLETFSVLYTPKGAPDRGAVVARTPDGRRIVARVTEAEPDALAFLVAGGEEPLGRSGQAFLRGDGWLHWALERPAELGEPEVLFERVAPHVARITLNRPAKRNAVNGAVTRLLAKYLQETEADPETRAVVLWGGGGEVFCAGADLSEVARGRGGDLSTADGGFAGVVTASRRKPWIAAVTGQALGGGTELALACDLVVAGEGARFGLPEVKRCIVAAAGGVYRGPRAMPYKAALELILTGEAIDAATARSLHLVNRVVPDAEALSAAEALAGAIAGNAPLAVQASLSIARQAFDLTDEQLSHLAGEAVMRVAMSEDNQEGVRAFLEKRPPNWRGR